MEKLQITICIVCIQDSMQTVLVYPSMSVLCETSQVASLYTLANIHLSPSLAETPSNSVNPALEYNARPATLLS